MLVGWQPQDTWTSTLHVSSPDSRWHWSSHRNLEVTYKESEMGA